jgi:hypothetical protein
MVYGRTFLIMAAKSSSVVPNANARAFTKRWANLSPAPNNRFVCMQTPIRQVRYGLLTKLGKRICKI